MRILLVDIETAPNLAWTFETRRAYISIDQIVEPSRMICFSAKWLGSDVTYFLSEHQDGGREAMLSGLWHLLDEADAVIHYNGKRFDIPKINGEFYTAGFTPPSPYQQIDLYLTIKKFSFPSSKLAYALRVSKLPGKLETGGFKLWVDCLAGDDGAWALMEKYNRQDVDAMEPLYNKLLPWITPHPNFGLECGPLSCPRCGKQELEKRGTRRLGTGLYQRYRCRNCRGWCQKVTREHSTDLREVAA